jgi:hypothetical protein
MESKRMKGRIAVLSLAMLLAAPLARAQESEASASDGAAPENRRGRIQAPGQIDVQANFNADVLLIFANAGVGVDVGVLPLGPGVLALGGELEAGACITLCLGFKLATGWDLSTRYLSPHARVTYHFAPPGNSPSLQKLDVYGLAFAGITYSTASVGGTVGNDRFETRGTDLGPSLGVGAGAKYFLMEDSGLFVGAEGRVRWAAGTYTWTASYGNVSISDSQSHWSLSGLNVQLFGGIRF